MELTLYQIDAFASKPFEGNPAAICPLDSWLPDDVMQSIAMENNLSETAFFVVTKDRVHIRWFTPKYEVDLCGHATLASAYVLFELLDYKKTKLEFDSRSGPLYVTRNKSWYEMDFPAQKPSSCEIPDLIYRGFNATPIECLKAEDYVVVFEDQNAILNEVPNFTILADLDLRGVMITAPGREFDFVSRFFAPKYGINEDPVTGSSFTQLIPYWSDKLKKKSLCAKQISQRGGEVHGTYKQDRVVISGQAVKYMQGTISI